MTVDFTKCEFEEKAKESEGCTKYDCILQPLSSSFDKHLTEVYSVKAANSYFYRMYRSGMSEEMCMAN